MNIKLALQILKEFWLPSMLASIWTIYSVIDAGENWSLASIINIFGPSFFLASWATGQIFRVKKQAKVESNLSDIESRVDHLVSKLEIHTKDFFGYTTGGNSIAYLMPMFPSENTLELGLLNKSDYPVFDIQIELIDLDEKIDPMKGVFWTRHRFLADSLYPNKMIPRAYHFDLSNKDTFKINIFIQARNTGVTQQIRFARVNGKRVLAIQTKSGNDVIEQQIPENFPNYDPTNIENVFK
jgi:hypothetical protein